MAEYMTDTNARRRARGFAVALALLVAVPASLRAQATDRPASGVAAVADSSLRRDLLRLLAEDQAGREGLGSAAARGDTVYMRRFLTADSLRSLWLATLVAERGWPVARDVGQEGVHAAFILLQHSPDTAFQARMLPTVERAAVAGELPAADVAMLTDRVLVQAGRPQRYGSSFRVVGGRLVADPIDDPAGLEARRRAVGMPAMADYARLLGEMYKLPVDWPPLPR